MISEPIIEQLRSLAEEGHSATYISRALGISYPTVLKYSNQERERMPMRIKEGADTPKAVIPYVHLIQKYIRSGITSSKKVEILLKTQGYRGSYQTLNSYLKAVRDKEVQDKARSYERVETGAGEQGQMDWGHFGKIVINGMPLHLYGFALVLSHSRALYAEFVVSQKQKTLQTCHINAFKYFGGIPKKIRYDNMKTVVTARAKDNGYELINWNFEFKNFAQYYKFEPELCPRYYPRSKGKVESAIRLLRHNFFHGEKFGKTFHTLEELNEKARAWLNQYANKRKHPRFAGVTVKELWQKEKKFLAQVENIPQFFNVLPQVRRVSAISMVSYKRASYWVPKEYIRHKVEVREVTNGGLTTLEFHAKDRKIAEYPIAPFGSWVLPDDRELIKKAGKKHDIEKRLKNNPLYSLKVEIRDLKYYQKLISEKK